MKYTRRIEEGTNSIRAQVRTKRQRDSRFNSQQAKVRVERQCKFPTIAKAPSATAVKLLERVLQREWRGAMENRPRDSDRAIALSMYRPLCASTSRAKAGWRARANSTRTHSHIHTHTHMNIRIEA